MSMQKRKINLWQINLGVFLLSFITVTLDSSIIIVLAPIVDSLMGDSGFYFGLIGTMVYVGNIVMVYSLVKISDWIGRKRTFMIANIITVIATFLLLFASKYWVILILRFVFGLNSQAGILSAYVIDHFPENERGKPLAMFSIGIVGGYLIGTIIGGPIYSQFGAVNSFLILGFISLLGVVNGMINIKNAPKMEINNKQEDRSGSKLNTWIFIRQNKSIVGIIILNFFNMLSISGAGTYAIFMIFTHFNLPELTGGLYLLPIQIIEVVAFALLGARVKNFNKTYKLLIGIIIVLNGFGVSFLFFENPIQFAVCCAFFGVAIAIIMQSTDAISHKLIPPEYKTNLVSIYRFVGILGNIMGPVLFGLLTDYIWIYSPGYFFIIGLILVEVLYWKWISKEQAVRIENHK